MCMLCWLQPKKKVIELKAHIARQISKMINYPSLWRKLIIGQNRGHYGQIMGFPYMQQKTSRLFWLVSCWCMSVRLELVTCKFIFIQVHKGKDFLCTGVGHIAKV